MPTTTVQKLKIKEGNTLLAIHAPADFEKNLGELPAGVVIAEKPTAFDQLHWFVKDKAQLVEEADKVVALLTEGVTAWIYYPKGSSKIQTDLTRDKGWESLKKYDLQWLSLVSFNDTWSAFAVRRKTATGNRKAAARKERPSLPYIDAATKTVNLPDDLAAALSSAASEKEVFDRLAFSHKKEYVEWIVSAKREETREKRIKETIERLGKGWKNPANR